MYKNFDEYWKAEGVKFTDQPEILAAVFREVALKAWNAACMARMSDVVNSTQKNTYPNGESFYEDNSSTKRVYGPEARAIRFKKTGEFRVPKKGEWFLSGTIPVAYYAVNDHGDMKFNILVKV